MTRKIGIITDTHYGIRSDNSIFYEYMKKSNEFFFKKFKEAGVDTIIHAGDLLDRRKFLNYITENRLQKDMLTPLSEYDSHIICGNHDVYYRNTNDINSLEAVVDKTEHSVYKSTTEIEIHGTKILLVPWINNSNYDETLEAIKKTKAEICIGHLEIAGFEMLSGIKCTHGLDYSHFKKFDLVCSGHFHHRSFYDPIQYLGAAYSFNWGDAQEPRGVSILDLETRTLEFIENPYNIFNTYTYHDKDKKQDEMMNIIDKQDYSRYTDTYVKVVVNSKEYPYLFDKLIDNMYEVKPTDIKIIDNSILFDDDDMIDENMKPQDTTEYMYEYIDGLGLNKEAEKNVKALMGELYKEAVSLENVE